MVNRPGVPLQPLLVEGVWKAETAGMEKGFCTA